MRSFLHWTPRYILDRLRVMRYEKNNPDHPWLTAEMIRVLSTWLRPTDVGLEFGSGRSTLWFSKRMKKLTSVEHDPAWYAKVAPSLEGLSEANRGGVDYLLFEDGLSESSNSEYVNVARMQADSSLDFVLVDGACRDYCAHESLSKLKHGGILVIDNVNWFIPRPEGVTSTSPASLAYGEQYASDTWAEVGSQVLTWRYLWTTNGVCDTALFQKP